MSEDDRHHQRKDAEQADDTASPRPMDAEQSGAGGAVSPDAGIRSMEERLEFLRAELTKWTATQKRYPARADDMNRRIADLQAAIDDTQTRLAEYRDRRRGNV